MIEFNGYLTGSAEKYFFEKSTYLGRMYLMFGIIAMLPVAIFLAIQIDFLFVGGMYCLAAITYLVLSFIPKSKKKKLSVTPKRICIDKDSMTCHADKYVESKFVKDVKQVLEFEEFYEIQFPFGNISDKFICQKDLLVKGSLAEFEELFEGKIRKM